MNCGIKSEILLDQYDEKYVKSSLIQMMIYLSRRRRTL